MLNLILTPSALSRPPPLFPRKVRTLSGLSPSTLCLGWDLHTLQQRGGGSSSLSLGEPGDWAGCRRVERLGSVAGGLSVYMAGLWAYGGPTGVRTGPQGAGAVRDGRADSKGRIG